MLTFLAIAAASGFASLLTPCVLPAIPLTLGFFGARRNDGVRPWKDVAAFAAGIVGTFTGVALVTTALVGASGINRLAADPWLNAVIGAVFVVSAGALLGAFTLRLPGRWVDRADRFASNAPVGVAPFAIGAVFSLATFACTAPFVGPLLVAASVGEWTRPVAGMLVYSSALGAPFVVLALAPSWVRRLPRAGAWLFDLRIILAAVQVAVALKFFSTALNSSGAASVSRGAILGAWVFIALGAAAVLGVRASRGAGRRAPRLAAAGALAAVAAWLGTGVGGRSVGELEALLPPPARAEFAWIADFDEGLALARRENRPLFVDFTGYSCGNCRWMEANVFTIPRVREALKPFVLVRLFTDGEGAPYERNQLLQEQRFGTVALPLYAVISPDGSTRGSLVGMTRDADRFVDFIRGTLD